MKKIRTALIGFGLSGAVFHAPYIERSDKYELAAICSSRTEEILRQYPGILVTNDQTELLNAKDIDLVVIATPTATHFPLAHAALNNGKHVVVEKPFVINSDEGRKLAELALRHNLTLSVYQNRRYDNDYLALVKCISDGLLGTIYSAEFRFDRFRPQATQRWKDCDIPGAGCLYDIAPHMIDHSLALFGWPETIYAEIDRQRPDSCATDYLHILLGYGKLKVNLRFSNFALHSGPRMLIYGDKGTFIKYGMDPQERLQPLISSGVTCSNAAAVSACLDNTTDLYYQQGSIQQHQKIDYPIGNYGKYYDDLYGAIVNNTAPPVTAEEATNVIRIIELATQSANLGKRLDIRIQ
ncbi:MAG: Gfo/Idh/MocA family oxidoreductase [Negativicutes bacterium]